MLTTKAAVAALRLPTADTPSTMNRDYIGVACPFLKNDRCSIYAQRPFICRTHYSMDEINLLCRLDAEPALVPLLNASQWHAAFITAHHPLTDPHAIRLPHT